VISIHLLPAGELWDSRTLISSVTYPEDYAGLAFPSVWPVSYLPTGVGTPCTSNSRCLLPLILSPHYLLSLP
jgi:hypothetical protein